MRHPFLALFLALTPLTSAFAEERLSQADVTRVLAQAVSRAAQVDPNAVIAVTDREGYVLGVWNVKGGATPNIKIIAGAVSRAGTAAFLSSNENAFTSRTAGFIIQQHFPPGFPNTPNGPLVGVGLSNIFLGADQAGQALFHSDVNFIKQIPTDAPVGTFDPNVYFAGLVPGGALINSPGTFGAGVFISSTSTDVAPGTGIPGTSLNDSPGGVPLYKNGVLVGAVGVTGDNSPTNISTGFALVFGPLQPNATPGFKVGPDTDEDVALAGQSGYEPSGTIFASNDFLGGIRIPYVASKAGFSVIRTLGLVGSPVAGFPVQASPPRFAYPALTLGGVAGHVHFDFRDDPEPGTIHNAARLTAAEVRSIIALAAARSGITRAGIRLPVGGPAQVFISVVGNPAKNGVAPPILGVFRTGDATMFSWDVSVQKARTALFFSTNSFAQSSRTVGFLAQKYYPPGLDGRPPGPYFGIQESLLSNAVKHGLVNANLPNGITIFPGGFPLYRNGQLIGAIGVSGDGVDQDDIIAISGCRDFAPNPSIRSDQFLYQGARLPYVKFPRDP